MKILIISQFFFPETGATTNRIMSFAQYFSSKGHEVHIIAEKPNHPEGVFHKGYEKGFFIDGEHNGIKISWCWVHTSVKKNFYTRIMFYLTFMCSSILASLRIKGKFDVVIATSPPLFVGVSGLIVSRIKKAKFVFDVRDLWPALAVQMGELTNKTAIRYSEKLEKYLYQKSNLISVATNSFKKEISHLIGDKKSIITVSNGTDPEIFCPKSTKIESKHKCNLPKGVIIGYIGNLGIVQSLSHIIECAKLFEDSKINDVFFLFVGEGPVKSSLMAAVNNYGLKNVIFKGRVSLDEAAEFMSASDLLLVPLANNPICENFVPSKMYDSMAAGRPVLLSVDGEAKEILTNANAGVFYTPEDSHALKSAIQYFLDSPQKMEEMGDNGKHIVFEHYTRKAQAKIMMDTIVKL
jgi:glycosyltransferase involved in cell wall biosynthesis